MRKIFNILSVILLSLSVSIDGIARNTPPGQSPGKPSGNNPALAAGCAAPNARTDIDLNNVRALILTGGDMFWDLTGAPRYEIPKGSGKHSIFIGSLWMGGVDVNGQLKLAAQRYRSRGNDFWPGPLNLQTVDIDAPTCTKFDRHFVVTKPMVEEFVAYNNDDDKDPNYTIPKVLLDWPGNGDPSKNEDWFLAPFIDVDGDMIYNPYAGDYPGYELVADESIDCKTSRKVNLYGDKTLWWVFNDKGNIHAETSGAPIGMEIRAQAFAFSTNDEVNNMTFFNYELINRSTFTLANTYFGFNLDPDLGKYDDDFVGCDVQRGLGYCYNGLEVDGTGGPGEYGANPPAVGVDFFEGPYQDNDGKDNPLVYDYNVAMTEVGIPYPGIGIGYGDGIVDNERFGMSRFVYYNNNSSVTGDPTTAPEYYNYLRGIWRDGTPMQYGGNGHIAGGGTGPVCKYMFPGTTDPLGWGTGGSVEGNWREETVNPPNVPFDRRFVQSAGSFTLLPGAVNDITVGIVWARAASGGPLASVEKLKIADDKAQALFDNCFRILEAPDAPDVAVVELDKEIILQLSNDKSNSTNYKEGYLHKDFRIPPSVIDANGNTVIYDQFYRFQGYLIYQLKNASVSPEELGNPNNARLVAQCDIKDNVSKIVNYSFNDEIGANVPDPIIINGENKGIYHSFRLTEDQFAVGDKRLVNHKSYYYMAIAYGYNNYKTYNPFDPLALDGQVQPYILSRKSVGASIKTYKAIPHNPVPLNQGTQLNSNYGDGFLITRIEGQGNGGLLLDFTADVEANIVKNNDFNFPTYRPGRGPVNVKVVDPLSVVPGEFEIRFDGVNDTSSWVLTNKTAIIVNDKPYAIGEFKVDANRAIKVGYEQLIPSLGISLHIQQVSNPGTNETPDNGVLGSSLSFSDINKQWLSGIPDLDGTSSYNWIRSGVADSDYSGKDPDQAYEKLLGGTWAPFGLVAIDEHSPGISTLIANLALLKDIKSVDVVFTSDKSKWTRCPVIENQFTRTLAQGGAWKNLKRNAPSVNKEGKPDGTGEGMGWFPGYAVCLETGERLNMAFAEDSWLAGDNGRDMLWNPSSRAHASSPGTPAEFQDIRFGGKHYIYVFGKSGNGVNDMPAYDEGKHLDNLLTAAASHATPQNNVNIRNAWRYCMWVGLPLLVDNQKLLSSEARVKLRVSRSYEKFTTSNTENNANPLYTFNTTDKAPVFSDALAADSALAMINIVPNPYYAYSAYEANQLDNIAKITNLPEVCTIMIYTINGTLIRKYDKADPGTSLNWDLKNQVGIPVASGIYLIHVNVPNIGERTLKWVGMMRPLDVESF
jgi:hypothetical protein